MGVADRAGLALDGKSRPRLRRQRKPAVSEKQRTCFLEMLADTCNVQLSAQNAGFRPQRAYDLRIRDASFRAGWDQALATGFAQLELMMLERALHGVEKMVRLPGGESRVMREYSDRVGLALLKMHREGASYANPDEVDAEEHQEACERIAARLERLRERERPAGDGAGRDASAVETKSGADRPQLLRWALVKARRTAGQ